MDDALEIIKPAPDSQYRLRPCKSCGGDNVAYVKYQTTAGPTWRVQCFDCGKTADPGRPAPRHEAQLLWNLGERPKATPWSYDIDDDRETCGLLEED